MRPVLTLLVVLAALAPTTAMASAWYRCADGAARSSCCCPADPESDEPVDGTPRMDRACCDVERSAAQHADRATPQPSAVALLAPPVARLRLDPMPVREVGATVATAAQPRGPPSLFLRHCAWLL